MPGDVTPPAGGRDGSPGGTESVRSPPFVTDAELESWLAAGGIKHVARLGVGVILPRLSTEQVLLGPARAVVAGRRLVELLSAESRKRWVSETRAAPRLAALLSEAAWRFVQDEARGTEEARAQIDDRLVRPDDPRTHHVHALLLELRERMRESVAPRPAAALSTQALTLDESLPGFRWKETRGSELPLGAHASFILPEAKLVFFPDAARAECTCRALSCVHVLAAIDTALVWLGQPFSSELGESLDALARPAWERALRALERALDAGADGGGGIEVAWRLNVPDENSVEVTPWVHRRGRKGQRSAGSRSSRRLLLQQYGGSLPPADARIAALLPESGPASRVLLLELEGHPRVFLEDNPELPVRIERAVVGLVAEQRGSEVIVSAGLDGASLTRTLVERLRIARPEEAVFYWERGARRLTVLDLSPEVRTLLDVLARHGQTFPPESHSALVDRLSALSARVPVAMPRSVMGEAVPAEQRPVLRLEALPDGRVRVELRTRPLADGPSVLPGEGGRDVHVRRQAGPVHTLRDFARERVVASELLVRLPVTAATHEEHPFAFTLESGADALDLCAAAGGLDPRPELEWVGPALRVVGSRGPGALRVVVEQKRAWFGVLGELSVEGERVELARLLDAARRKQRFVQVSGGSYVEIEEALRRHLEGLADHTYVSRHGVEIGPSAVLAVAELAAGGVEVDADRTWRELSTRVASAAELVAEVPAALEGELRDYQLAGFRWLMRLAAWGAGGILADDMGLGKTVQALAVLLARSALGPAVVVAPTSVAWNWIDEARRFAPSLRTHLLSESDDRLATLEKLGPGDVLVVSYGLLVRDVDALGAVPFATVVFDEAQQLKNPRTQRFRAARALRADFSVALSGTPLENHLGELWSLFAVVFPGLLGSWESFAARFAVPIERGNDPTAAPALARVLRPFLLRRTKAQVESQLPPRTDVRVPVVLSSEGWAMYEDARLAALSDLETPRAVMREQQRRVQVLAALTRMRLLASHPRLYDQTSSVASSKLERLLELVRELGAEGHRALVFSPFTSHLALVREALEAEGIAYEYLDGATPAAERAARVHAFQEGSAPLFLISLKAGGVGLNLTAATSVIHLDPWWNPAVEDQASDRAHRIGQDRPVTVYRMVTRGTIEETMLALHEQKRALVAGVLEGKDAAGQLSTDELVDLLASPMTTAGRRPRP